MKGRGKRSKVEGQRRVIEGILGHGKKVEFYVKYKESHCKIFKAREEIARLSLRKSLLLVLEKWKGAAMRGQGEGQE